MTIEARSFRLADDGVFPNNQQLPLLVYPPALKLSGRDPAAVCEDRLHVHQWKRSWRNGIFDCHRYHRRAPEFLGVYRGAAWVRFGGPQGIDLEVRTGDVVVIPAGLTAPWLQ